MLEVDDSEKRKLLHEETTSKIIDAAFEVHDQLGYGFLERVYQGALQVELLRGATAELEKRIQVHYKGAVVGDYDIDVLVDSCVAVEVKVAPQYDKRDEARL
jgi:GxxExxY protein